MAPAPALVWFRLDLRLEDNPALAAAVRRGGPVIPVYIQDDAGEGAARPGAASRWWLHHSLGRLRESLRRRGSDLVIRRGEARSVLAALVGATGATALYWNRRYEPPVIARDTALKSAFNQTGLEVESFSAALLHEPYRVKNRSGQPFQVFTPFWKHCLSLGAPAAPTAAPTTLPAPAAWPPGLDVDELGLAPTLRWDAGLAERWQPGEAGAQRRLDAFLARLGDYAVSRDFPGHEGTSSLSPHLHFGEISPRRLWAAVAPLGPGAEAFQRELGWREFASHLLFHFPHTAERPLRAEFEAFPWRNDPGALRAWQRGRTGYPIVDAGLRELWATGWMHNRVRMIAGSFLVKDLLIDWRAGAAWFWDTLVDADLAANTLGWQWTAGCGADAAPYFRIFSPALQGARFDPAGAYVRRWVPELARLPEAYLHQPWTAPAEQLQSAGIQLGSTYPRPIVEHRAARMAALAALQTIKTRRSA